MSAICDSGFRLVNLPPYSPDLALSDYYLFPNMKKNLSGKQYQSDDDVIFAVKDFLRTKKKHCLKLEIQMLKHL